MEQRTQGGGRIKGSADAKRVECECRYPAVLLATIEPNGTINIKSRERSWGIVGEVQTKCPRCGRDHRIRSNG